MLKVYDGTSFVEIPTGVLDAALLGYSPAVLADWLNSLDPGEVSDALDQLAAEKAGMTGLPNTDNAIMRADGTTGDVQDSQVDLSDIGEMSNVRTIEGESGQTLLISGNNAGETGAGDTAKLQGGAGGTVSGDGAPAEVFGGTPPPGGSGNGGPVNIKGRDGVGTNKDGGDVKITAGNNTGSGNTGKIQFDRTIESDTDLTDDLGTSSVFWNNLYAAHAITSPRAQDERGLISYFPLEDGNANDWAGSNDGTVSGATATAHGRIGEAYSFDGTDHINVDDVLTNDLSSTTKGTWSVWAMATDATPSAITILLSFNDTSANEFIHLRIKTTGELMAKCTDAGTAQWALETDAAAFADDTWVHIAITHDGTAPVLYVDGVAVAQTFTTSTDKTKWFSALTGLDNGRIGRRNVNGGGETNGFDGVLDEVKFYDRALSAAEIEAEYLRGKNHLDKSQGFDVISIGNTAEGNTGRLTRRTSHETHTLAISTTSDTTTISIPSGARLLGVSMNVNTAVTTDFANNTWSAAFITGSTTSIAGTGTSGSQNTKVDTIIADDEKTSATTQIRFTAGAGEGFTAGVIEIVAYYEELTSLADV